MLAKMLTNDYKRKSHKVTAKISSSESEKQLIKYLIIT